MTAGHDERNEREDRLGRVLARVEEPAGVQVALEVIHPHQRAVVDPGKGLADIDPDEQGASQAGAIGHGDRIDIGHARTGRAHGLVKHGEDPAEMRPSGNLRHDPTGRGMHRHLAGNDVGMDLPTPLDEGDPGLVAG